jgi:hypothetical protein
MKDIGSSPHILVTTTNLGKAGKPIPAAKADLELLVRFIKI